MCPLLAQLKIGFFSSFSAAAVYSTNETNKTGLKQSIIFRCLWFHLCLPACIFARLPTCPPARLPAFLPSCLAASQPPSQPAFLPSCLPACLPASLPALNSQKFYCQGGYIFISSATLKNELRSNSCTFFTIYQSDIFSIDIYFPGKSVKPFVSVKSVGTA